jgi:hypothetical protein
MTLHVIYPPKGTPTSTRIPAQLCEGEQPGPGVLYEDGVAREIVGAWVEVAGEGVRFCEVAE